MAAFTHSVGRFTASVDDLVMVPRSYKRNVRPPVVWCNGLNGLPPNTHLSTNPAMSLAYPLLDKGYVIGVPNLGATWGNATGRSRITDTVTHLRNNYGATSEKIILMSGSHGSGVAFMYAANNPTLVACIVAWVPAIDFQALRVSNALNVRASIDAAFGVTYPAALPANSNPAVMTASLAGIPIQSWTASDDPISENHGTFETAVGAEAYNLGALGHTDAAVTAVDEQVVKNFVLRKAS